MESKGLPIVADFPTSLPHEVFPQRLVSTPPLSRCEVCVIVPVRNEVETLELTLNALVNQVGLNGQPLDPTRYEIILLANNCNDDSAALARLFARQHPDLALHVVERTLPSAEAYIGRVRQLLMDEAYYRLSSLGCKRGIIASTDGDSQVSPIWLSAIQYEIAYGADAVGGRLLTNRADRAALDPYARACHLRAAGYSFLIAELESYLDPDPYDYAPRHDQHGGASLAVTVEMYARAGGLPPVRTSEDVAFYQALLRVNARFRHSPLVRVVTSARLTGRATGGQASQLSEWAAMGRQQQPFLVDSAEAIATRLQTRHQLRGLWRCILNGYQPTVAEVALLADRLGVTAQWLVHLLAQPYTFGFLFEQVEQRQQQEGIWAQRWSLVDIREAIWELRLLVDRCRRRESPASTV